MPSWAFSKASCRVQSGLLQSRMGAVALSQRKHLFPVTWQRPALCCGARSCLQTAGDTSNPKDCMVHFSAGLRPPGVCAIPLWNRKTACLNTLWVQFYSISKVNIIFSFQFCSEKAHLSVSYFPLFPLFILCSGPIQVL